ncbi:hypothetical protein H7849_06930 [Alloacidobacterium dinghuense]|uniref:Uncharacterized protein n=1 Tax=Alloacidobacterium dinghuense TaxID=2763107 RepID=A0A7G8BM87_9BACT|nr:hypothetical protein [Alloacidobacterium dinghuense]QNI33657.1 hypothetical protein H7849_06930 [Alloacidobacterium dinghuense]
MSTAVGDQRVFTELWISFVSLVRSYIAAHDLGRIEGRAFVDEGEDGRLTVREQNRILVVDFDVQTGKGEWAMYDDEPGPERRLSGGGFRIGADSLVTFSDRRSAVEMEIAAEAFTAKVFDQD